MPLHCELLFTHKGAARLDAAKIRLAAERLTVWPHPTEKTAISSIEHQSSQYRPYVRLVEPLSGVIHEI
jgi:hypothetical protein